MFLIGPLLPLDKDVAEMERKLKTVTSPIEKRTLLVKLANSYKLENPTQSLTYGKEALALLRDYPDDSLKLTLLNALSWTYAELGVLQEALVNGWDAEKLAVKLGDKNALAVASASIANTYCGLSDFDKALKYSLKTLAIYEEMKEGEVVCGVFAMHSYNYGALSVFLLDRLHNSRPVPYIVKTTGVLVTRENVDENIAYLDFD